MLTPSSFLKEVEEKIKSLLRHIIQTLNLGKIQQLPANETLLP